ncbi:hypothetical protein AB0L88_30075 [Saccharopolyspora shandongensis]
MQFEDELSQTLGAGSFLLLGRYWRAGHDNVQSVEVGQLFENLLLFR